MRKINLKLAHKVIFLLTLIVFGLMAIYSFIQMKRIEKTLANDAEKHHILLLSNSLSVFSKSLWDFDKEVCAKAVEALFEGGTVERIQIFNKRGELFYGMKFQENKEGHKVLIEILNKDTNYSDLKIGEHSSFKEEYSEVSTQLISPIQNFPNQEHRLVASLWWKSTARPAKLIGNVIMDFSTHYILKRIQDQKESYVYLTFILSGTILSLTFLFLQFYVISPIRKLMEASLDVSEGKFTKLKPLKSKDEIGHLTDNFNFMVNKIERNLQFEKDRAHLERDLELAKSVQNTLLSRKLPTSKQYDICTYYKPASQCGGDWYGVYEFGKDKILVLLGDVSGHGTPAALITAVTCGAAEMLMQSTINVEDSEQIERLPANVLEALNKCIFLASNEKYLMTMVAVLFDLKTEKMIISSAGHNPPALLTKQDGNTSSQLIQPPIGYRLGAKSHAEYKTKTFDFKPTQQIVLYTDGIVEAENSLGKEYGNKNFKRSLEKHADKDPEVFLKEVTEDTFQYCEKGSQKDDITILLLRFLKNDVY